MPKSYSAEPWANRLAYVLQRRSEGGSKPGTWRRIRADLRRGNSPFTEHYAYPHVLPWLDEDASKQDQTVMLRLFALVAEFDDIPARDRSEKGPLSFGRWCHHVSVALARSHGESFHSDPEEPDSVAQRLQFLHALKTEEALANVSRIMKIASTLPGVPPALDYFDLFRTFRRWGGGISPQSQAARRSVLRDYYSAFTPEGEPEASGSATASSSAVGAKSATTTS